MQNYLTQLLEYLEEAKERKPQPRYIELPPEMEALRDVIDMEMSWQENERTMEAIFGVPQIYFPPVERLTDDQLKMVVDAILSLWRVFNYEADLPQNIPAKYAYTELVKCWKKGYPLLKGSNGTWHIEFCNYDTTQCPWPSKFCSCKEF